MEYDWYAFSLGLVFGAGFIAIVWIIEFLISKETPKWDTRIPKPPPPIVDPPPMLDPHENISDLIDEWRKTQTKIMTPGESEAARVRDELTYIATLLEKFKKGKFAGLILPAEYLISATNIGNQTAFTLTHQPTGMKYVRPFIDGPPPPPPNQELKENEVPKE